MSNGPLAVAGFRRLTLAWAFSNFGDSALYLTLAIWVKDLTGSDASAGLVFLFLGLPAFLAPLAGHLADRFPRRPLTALANLGAALGVGALVLVDSAAQVWIIYAVAFGYGLITYLTSACASGLIKDLVDDDHLASANGLLSSIDQGLRLLSPLAGAGLYALFGGASLALLTAGTLLVAAVLVMTIRMTESPPTPVDQRERFATEVAAGMRHLQVTPGLARLTLWLAAAIGVTGFANVVIFAAIDQGLGRGSTFFAVLASAQGIGAVVGGVSAALVIRWVGETPTIALGLAAFALAFTTLLTTSTAAMLVGAFVAGIGIPLAFVSYTTIRQRVTPGPLQGRVASASTLAFNGPQTLVTALGAALVAVVDYRVLVAAMVLTAAVAAAAVVRTRVPSSDQVIRPVPGTGRITSAGR